MSSCGPDYKIESIVTVDLKGQIVLPKNLRERAGFKPNDKLALVSFEKEGEVCCVIMLKAKKLDKAVTKALSVKFQQNNRHSTRNIGLNQITNCRLFFRFAVIADIYFSVCPVFLPHTVQMVFLIISLPSPFA